MSPEPEPPDDGLFPVTLRPSGPFSISSSVLDGTAVLSLAGRVDLAALPTCRRAVDDLLREGITLITVDLRAARFDDESIALLALMRRYTLRRGARLTLADIPPHVARVLDRTGVGWLYRQDDENDENEDDPPGDTPPGDTPPGDAHARRPTRLRPRRHPRP